MTTYRLEAWSASIALATCTADEYDAAVACSDPSDHTFTTRDAVEAWLDLGERCVDPARDGRRFVEVFLYIGRSTTPHATYRRARNGAYVLAGSEGAL